MGGYMGPDGGEKVTDSVEQLTEGEKDWVAIENLHHPLRSLRAVTVNNTVYLTGLLDQIMNVEVAIKPHITQEVWMFLERPTMRSTSWTLRPTPGRRWGG